MKPDKSHEELIVTFDLDWVADTDFFDFDTDLDKVAISETMALEPWSREFFNQLKE